MEYHEDYQMVIARDYELSLHGITPAEVAAGKARGGYIKTALDGDGKPTNYYVSMPMKEVRLPDQFGERR